MKRSFVAGIAGLLTITMPVASLAGNPFEEAFQNSFRKVERRVTNQIEGVVTKGLEGLVNDVLRFPKITRSSGFCQVWRGKQLAVVSACQVTNKCSKKTGTCTHSYKWQNAGTSVIQSQNGKPYALNSGPIEQVLVGNDTCVFSGSNSESFCFTTAPQSADLMQRDTSVATTYTEEAPVEAQGSAENPQFELIFDEYVETTEGTDAASVKKRCDLGLQLVVQYKAEMDEEILSLVKQQIKLDKCLG